MSRRKDVPLIKVALSFYPAGEPEVSVWEWMPQVPAAGDTVFYNPDRDLLGRQKEDGTRSWNVDHVSWVCDDDAAGKWHAEIGLS